MSQARKEALLIKRSGNRLSRFTFLLPSQLQANVNKEKTKMDSSGSVSEPPPLYPQLPEKTSVGVRGTLNWKFSGWGGAARSLSVSH